MRRPLRCSGFRQVPCARNDGSEVRPVSLVCRDASRGQPGDLFGGRFACLPKGWVCGIGQRRPQVGWGAEPAPGQEIPLAESVAGLKARSGKHKDAWVHGISLA